MDFNDDENIEWLMESSKTVENVGEDDADLEQRERESFELYQFLQVLRSCFENEPILIESKAKGTLKCEEDFQKLIKRLKVIGYFFSIRTSEKRLGRENCKLMVLKKKSACHPYRVISHWRYSCAQRNKEDVNSELESSETDLKKYPNCRAMMDIREVEIFTSVHLSHIRRRKMMMLRKFRRSVHANTNPDGEIKYCVVISLPKTHNHVRQVKGQFLNDDVKATMHYVLRTGTTSLQAIQDKIYRIVDQEFENDSIKPSRENTAFYPNQKTIYNHLRRDGLSVKKVYRKNGTRLRKMKDKTKELMGTIIEKIDHCPETDVVAEIYKHTQYMSKLLESVEESEAVTEIF